MHPVNPWMVIFSCIFCWVLGGSWGFSIGIHYVLKRQARDRLADASKVPDRKRPFPP